MSESSLSPVEAEELTLVALVALVPLVDALLSEPSSDESPVCARELQAQSMAARPKPTHRGAGARQLRGMFSQ